MKLEGTPASSRVVLRPSGVVPERPRVLLSKVFISTRVVLESAIWKMQFCEKLHSIWNVAPEPEVECRFKLRVQARNSVVNLEKSTEKIEGHVVRSPRALIRVVILELKDQPNCARCLE